MEKRSSVEYACTLVSNNYKHVLEFGVASGRSLKSIRDNLNESYKVFGFDCFDGLPEDWIDTCCDKGSFSTNGIIPNIENVTFFKGLFAETIPEYFDIAKPIALLHVDCDLYSSTKEVLYSLNSWIKKDTIIVFDEWVYMSNHGLKDDHEQKCFYEWVKDYKRQFEFIHFESSYDNEHEKKIVRILK